MLSFGLHFLPVPRQFWSAYLDGPFCDCVVCKTTLSNSLFYVIQKRIVAGESVFEMAICEACRQQLTASYSEETRAALTGRMSQYFRQKQMRLEQQEAAPSVSDSPAGYTGGRSSVESTPEGNDLPADQTNAADENQQSSLATELLNRCMNFCLICDRSREQCHRYSLAGLFRQKEIVVQTSFVGQSPVMICDDCEQSLAGLISKQTRDNWDKFVEQHFDGPPSIDIEDPSYSPMAF